jgi:hypothetical protein
VKNAPALAILLRKYHPFSSILLGISIYCIGLLICYSYGATSFYLVDLFFPALTIGIIVVSYHYVWLFFNHLHKAIAEIGNNFSIPPKEFEKIRHSYFKSVNNDKISLIASIPGFVFIIYLISLIWNGSMIYFGQLPPALQGNLVYFSFSTIASCFGMYLILSPCYMMLCTYYTLRKLTAYPAKIQIMQKRNRLHLDKVVGLNLRIVLVWFIGLSLMMVNLLTLSGYEVLLSLFFVLLFGLGIFFIPQFLIRKSILSSKEKLLSQIEGDLLSNTNIPLSSNCDSQKSLLLYMLYERTEKISEWPLNTQPLMELTFYAIIPILTTIIGTLIK